MGLPVRVNLQAYRGDTWEQSFRFLDGVNPIDLTGATLKASARARDGSLHDLVVTYDGDTTTLTLPEAGIPAGTYAYDLEVSKDAGEGNIVVTTWVAGELHVARDVTNELP